MPPVPPPARILTPPAPGRVPPVPMEPALTAADGEGADERAPSADVFGDVAQSSTLASPPDGFAIDTDRDVLESAGDWDLPPSASGAATPGANASGPEDSGWPDVSAATTAAIPAGTADQSESILSAYLAEEEFGAEQLAPMNPEDAASSEFAVPDRASDLRSSGETPSRKHLTPDRVFTAHGMDDAALIETETPVAPPPDASGSRGDAGGGHANVYSDGTFAADTVASWDDATSRGARAGASDAASGVSGAGRAAVVEPENAAQSHGVAEALERVARQIRAGELHVAGGSAGATDAAALAAALAALLGARR